MREARVDVAEKAESQHVNPRHTSGEIINKALVVYGEVLKMAIEGDFEVRLINLVGDERDFILSVREAA